MLRFGSDRLPAFPNQGLELLDSLTLSLILFVGQVGSHRRVGLGGLGGVTRNASGDITGLCKLAELLDADPGAKLADSIEPTLVTFDSVDITREVGASEQNAWSLS